MIDATDARPFTPRIKNNLAGYMSEYERTVLVALANIARPKRVLEIGVQRGEAARMLLDNVPSITQYVGVDVKRGYVFGLPVQANERPTIPGELALQDTRFTLMLLKRGSYDIDATQVGKFDMVLVDGDHSRAAVTNDNLLADAVCNPNGLIVWHDYGSWCEDINDILNARQVSGHNIFHAADTMLAWEWT